MRTRERLSKAFRKSWRVRVAPIIANVCAGKLPPNRLRIDRGGRRWGQFVAGATGGSLQAQTFAIIGATRTLQLFLNASDNRSRVRMLSAPSILVTDNTSARVQVGSQVPVPIGSSLTPVQSGSRVLPERSKWWTPGSS